MAEEEKVDMEQETSEENPQSFSDEEVTVTETTPEAEGIKNVELNQLAGEQQAHEKQSDLELILDVEVPVSVELGRTDMPIGQILELGPGSIIELNKMASDPVDLFVNNKLVARGEVVVVDENFGIRITAVVDAKHRVKSLA